MILSNASPAQQQRQAMHNANAFKVGLFGANLSGADRNDGARSLVRELAQLPDDGPLRRMMALSGIGGQPYVGMPDKVAEDMEAGRFPPHRQGRAADRAAAQGARRRTICGRRACARHAPRRDSACTC
jgi:hypothetical protein